MSFSSPRFQNFIQLELQNLFLVGKNALIAMLFILINKGLFELKYVYSNLIVKNHKNFFSNLIYIYIYDI